MNNTKVREHEEDDEEEARIQVKIDCKTTVVPYTCQHWRRTSSHTEDAQLTYKNKLY